MAIRIAKHDVSGWGLARAAVAVAYCFVALVVIFDLSDKYQWGGFSFRAPIWLLVVWAYSPKWRNPVVDGVALVSVAALAGAYALMTPSIATVFPKDAELFCGQLALASLALAVAIYAGFAVVGWRRDRARLKASSTSPLDRAAGGF